MLYARTAELYICRPQVTAGMFKCDIDICSIRYPKIVYFAFCVSKSHIFRLKKIGEFFFALFNFFLTSKIVIKKNEYTFKF